MNILMIASTTDDPSAFMIAGGIVAALALVTYIANWILGGPGDKHEDN